MKKKLFINKLIGAVITAIIILTMVAGWYFTNNPDPSNASNETLEQIQQEEGLK